MADDGNSAEVMERYGKRLALPPALEDETGPITLTEKLNTALENIESMGFHEYVKNLPESSNVIDNRNLPESKKPSDVSVMFDMFEREYHPYTAGETYPTPKDRRRATNIARAAGIDSIPMLGNKINPNSDLYPSQQGPLPDWMLEDMGRKKRE